MRFEMVKGEAVYSGFVNGGAPRPLPDGAPPAKNIANTNVGVFGDVLTDGLAKHDYDTGATVVVDGPDYLTSPSEPTFVMREGGVAEDDGYLLTLWWNRQTGLSELVIHAAAALTREPLARVPLPARVPFGFHGNWAGAAVLDRAVSATGAAEQT